MKCIVDSEIFSRFPNVTIGILSATGLQSRPSDDYTAALLSAQEERIRNEFTKENFTEHPFIQTWRKVYGDFGVKPKDAKSSIENLYRIVLSGRDVRRISQLVDIYNSLSLKHMLPFGAEDIEKIAGDVTLTFASSDEAAVQLLGDEAAEKPKEGEVIYKDQVSAICRRWNWREADRTKLTDSTTKAIFVIEGVDCVPKGKVNEALRELEELIVGKCGGVARRFLLDSDTRTTEEI